VNFSELKTELKARGFDDLSDARAGVYVNAARAELDRLALWPWREKSVTGTAPVTVSDLGTIEKVLNTSQSDAPLRKVDYQTLIECYSDLSTAGSPWAYYVAWPSGSPVVATYPTSSDTIGVQFWRVSPTLTGTDTPLSPENAHYLIVDLAVRRAYRDRDNHQAAESVQSEIDRQLDGLLVQFPPGIADGPDAYVGVGYHSEDW
jgi:hypothetical protein